MTDLEKLKAAYYDARSAYNAAYDTYNAAAALDTYNAAAALDAGVVAAALDARDALDAYYAVLSAQEKEYKNV